MKLGAMMTDASTFWADKMTDEYLLKHLEMLDVLRFSFGPSDFSETKYSWGSLHQHHLAPEEKRKIEVLERVNKITGGRIQFVAGPWAPPIRLMNRARSHTEDDIDEPVQNWAADYAEVLNGWVELYAKHGIKLEYLSLQNEPMMSTVDYPSKMMTPDQLADLRKELYKINPEIKVAHYDHNPEPAGIEFVQKLVSLGALAPGDVSAWHLYSGNIEDVKTIEPIRNGTLGIIITEVASDSTEDYKRSLKWHTDRIARAKALGATMYMYHNLFLDATGGPNLRQSEGFLEEPMYTVEFDPIKESCEVKDSWAIVEAFKNEYASK